LNIETDLRDTLTARAKRCVRVASGHLSEGEFFLGGGAVATRDMNDIDIYPAGDAAFTIPKGVILASSKNATTIGNAPPLQFCNYKRATLAQLVASFDFAHIQARAHVKDGAILSVEWTPAFVAANACRTSEFTGSDYPLSSSIRLLKYNKRGELTRHHSIHSMLNIIREIVERGFKDYEDFKDQLDAVDLGLNPEELEGVVRSNVMRLFELLRKDKP